MISRQATTELRDILVSRAMGCRESYGPWDVALSGGIDSATALFAALEGGYKPRCITFALGTSDSPDVKVSVSMCKAFGLEHEIVRLPETTEALLDDIKWVLQNVEWGKVGKIKKTIIQCVHPWRYLAPAASGHAIMTGFSADSYFLSTNDAVRLYAEYGEAAWREYGMVADSIDPTTSMYHAIDVSRRVFSKEVIDFYACAEFDAAIKSLSTADANKPVAKYPLLAAFEDYWKRGSWYRPHGAYQIVSKLREFHDRVMAIHPYTGHGAVVGAYGQMARELNIHVHAETT